MNLADPPLARTPPPRPATPRDAVRDLGESTALPRVTAAQCRAFNRLHDHRVASLALPWRGDALNVHWTADDAALPPCDCYRFRLGTQAGIVALDAPAQIELLGEARLDRLPAALRAILLAEATRHWADALEKATRQRFEWTPGDECVPFDAQRAACFRLAGPGGETWRGYVQFDDAAALDAFVPPLATGGAGVAVPARLRFPLRWRLGETRIRLHEMRGIARGDILSIEDWRAAGAAVVVSAELGGAGGLRLAGLAEGSRITLQQTRDDTMNRSTETPLVDEPHDATELPIDRLDALEVTLRFEVGDLQLSLGELKNLRAGHVFELGQPLNRSPVRILAHGNLLGKGTLVAVGDRLGVRVSEFAPGEL